jgi:methionyl-tRNA formyltransferase
MRLLLLGDGLWSVKALQHIRAFADVSLVLGRLHPTDSSLELACIAAAIPYEQPRRINSKAWIERLNGNHYDCILSVSYDQIFRAPLLQGVHCPIVNIHAGDPARFRGRAILTWQLIQGFPSVQLCAMLVDEGIDTGIVLARQEVNTSGAPHYASAMERVCQQLPHLIDTLFHRDAEGEISLAFESHLPTSLGTTPRALSTSHEKSHSDFFVYPRRVAGDECMDFKQSADELQRFVRALTAPNPGATLRYQGSTFRVGDAEIVDTQPPHPSSSKGFSVGHILACDAASLLVQTGRGLLRLLDIRQKEDPSHAACTFIRGESVS